MNEQIDPIPENMTIMEATEFWDTHSAADYASQVVDMAYTPDEETIVQDAEHEVGKIPKFKSEQEEADFWDEHESTDFFGDTEEIDQTFVDVRPGRPSSNPS